jgi:hypothetical protein
MFRKQGLEVSPFDTLGLRRSLWDKLVAGNATIVCRSCIYAKVLYILPKGSRIQIPEELWGNIFRWFGSPTQGGKWRVFWFPAETPRRLPSILSGEPVSPHHINGGYTMPCEPDGIVVYRKEEATRVLIHELLHAACTDSHIQDLTMREATTETWAELLLIAILSGDSQQRAMELWKKQATWIANQNEQLRMRYGVKTHTDYAWRYTIAREMILQNLHISLPPGKINRGHSSRLTDPHLGID